MDMNFLFYLLYQINLIKLSKLEITFIILQKYHAFLQTIQTTTEKKNFYVSYNFNDKSCQNLSLFASPMKLKVVLSATILKWNKVFDMRT